MPSARIGVPSLLPFLSVAQTTTRVKADCPNVLLRNGVSMPILAAGTWQYNDTEAANSVQLALQAGFTHIDTANDYGNQRGVGAGLAESGVDRSRVFVTTKVPGCGLQGVRKEYCAEDTALAISEDLKLLGEKFPAFGGQVDLILLHFPPCVTSPGPPPTSPSLSTCNKDRTGCSTLNCVAIQQQWRALQLAYQRQQTRAIGVSNFCSACLECLSGENVAPMVNQVQLHVGMGPDPQHFISYAASKGIAIQAWSPFGSGGHGSSDILSGNLTTTIAAKYNKSPAQVALKWLTSKGASVATKSSSLDHLRENLDLFDFDLTSDDVAALDGATFASTDTPSFMCDDA